MFRLEKNQIHIVFILLLIASVFVFGFFGMRNIPDTKVQSSVSVMEDFSDGWISSYETRSPQKIEKKQGANEKGKTVTVTEILSLPEIVPVDSGKTVTMTQKLPDYGQENIYLLFKTKAEMIQVIVDEQLVYESGHKEQNIECSHIVSIDKEFRNHMVTVKLTGSMPNELEIQKVLKGTYVNLLAFAWQESGIVFSIGVLLLIFSIVMLIPLLLIHNIKRQKAVLFYGSLESIFFSIFLILESRLFQAVTGWNYTLYLLKICILILTMVLHIAVINSNMYKKRVLFFTSLGIIFYGILFISIMVFQAFSLITVETACRIVEICVILGILVYTAILLIAICNYQRKEGRVLFAANLMIVFGICGQMADIVINHKNGQNIIYIALCSLFYMFIVFVYGIRLALDYPQKAEKGENIEEQLRQQLVERLNPNLLFASFHTLQNLIKNGSANSVKMIYYISIYMRDNLRAFEHAGEIVSFGTEMEHIIAYLQLQKTRNQNLNFSMECKETDFKVPQFSIEPMVENAVKYGIANHGNQGNVIVRTYQRPDGYALQVIDDGIGFNKNILKKNSPTALLNLFSVLENTCNAEVKLVSNEGAGTVITIVFPMLENDLIKENFEDE